MLEFLPPYYKEKKARGDAPTADDPRHMCVFLFNKLPKGTTLTQLKEMYDSELMNYYKPLSFYFLNSMKLDNIEKSTKSELIDFCRYVIMSDEVFTEDKMKAILIVPNYLSAYKSVRHQLVGEADFFNDAWKNKNELLMKYGMQMLGIYPDDVSLVVKNSSPTIFQSFLKSKQWSPLEIKNFKTEDLIGRDDLRMYKVFFESTFWDKPLYRKYHERILKEISADYIGFIQYNTFMKKGINAWDSIINPANHKELNEFMKIGDINHYLRHETPELNQRLLDITRTTTSNNSATLQRLIERDALNKTLPTTNSKKSFKL